ncbi:hypothetical protein FACS18942_07610 [Planctomycetales bacterium]|nr:hypothetical protein FACS18942_07610 [Planctomycetales bacterium]
MKRCCQYESRQINDLPFNYQLIFDYYDGPLEGFTFCDQCGKGYYFNLLQWDDATQDCRVFGFTCIKYTYKQMIRIFDIREDYVGFIPLDIPLPQGMLSRFSQKTINNICASDDHFRTGIWRKILDSERKIIDWIKYLNLHPPNDSQGAY